MLMNIVPEKITYTVLGVTCYKYSIIYIQNPNLIVKALDYNA